ncbi:MAG: methionyl-tRNA formyltransferase, partial [Clostridiales bacterium]|nr:methionyl-tRNA formyltransferase [Clostridiales bacterium]
VKELALGKTEIYQPASLKDGEAERILKGIAPDLIAVVAYGRILPPELLEAAPKGCINIHASLLPKYRGAAPIQRAVLAGEKITGVTSMHMAPELDSGDIILTKATKIRKYETSGQLFERLALLGAELLSETIDAIDAGTAPRTPQDHALATFAPPLKKSESPVDWSKDAPHVVSQICGLDPWPGASTQFGGTVYKLFSPKLAKAGGGSLPGEVISVSGGLTVACGSGAVTITELQAAGKKRMPAADFLRGHKIEGVADDRS